MLNGEASRNSDVARSGSALAGHDLPVNRALRQLRGLTMAVPAVFIAALEVAVHLVVGDRIPRVAAVLLVLGIVAAGSALFAWLIFGILKRIQDRLVQRNRQIAVVHTAGLSLASEMTLEPLLRKFVDLACEITNAKYGALGIISPEGGLERFITSGLSDEERALIGDPPAGRGLLAVMIGEGASLRLKDLTQDPRSAGFPRIIRRCARSWACRSSIRTRSRGTCISRRSRAPTSSARRTSRWCASSRRRRPSLSRRPACWSARRTLRSWRSASGSGWTCTTA